MPDEQTTKVELSRGEGLVLFEWLRLFNEGDHPDLFEASAERNALWSLEAILEKSLVEPFAPNSEDLLQRARGRLTDSETALSRAERIGDPDQGSGSPGEL